MGDKEINYSGAYASFILCPFPLFVSFVKFEFKIKRQEKAFCTKVSMEAENGNSFQSYMRVLGFAQCRMGYLYGYFQEEDNSVKVEAMYEPPQECSPTSFTILDDPHAEKVEELAKILGLKKVGWIFAHPPREEHFLFSQDEVVMAAVGQLEEAQGLKETPFVTVRVSIDTEGQVHYDAFQVYQLMQLNYQEGGVIEKEIVIDMWWNSLPLPLTLLSGCCDCYYMGPDGHPIRLANNACRW